jgi:uncharacterized protein YndB with AHSA1/START domain
MTGTPPPRQSDHGALEHGEGTVTVRFRRQFPHPPEKVWRALTQAEHLDAWFPTTIEGDLSAPGTTLRFAFREVEMEPMEGELLACKPPELLEFIWGDETLRFELTAHDGGTTVDFTATFAEIGKAARDAAGWHVCLDQLDYELDGRAWPSDDHDDRWRLVHRRYVSRFGPEASTIGPPTEWQERHGPVDEKPS